MNIHFICGHRNPKAALAFEALTKRYGQCKPDKMTHLVPLGGDGTQLDAAHWIYPDWTHVKIFGLNYGSYGHMMNRPLTAKEDLVQLLDRAVLTEVHPFKAVSIDLNGAQRTARGFNEVLVRHVNTDQALHLEVRYNGRFMYGNLWADGLLVAPPLGSTAYSSSAGGQIVPVTGWDVMLLSPSNPMRILQRKYDPEIVAAGKVTVRVLEPDWRLAEVKVDNVKETLPNVQHVTITREETPLLLLHRPDATLNMKNQRLAQMVEADRVRLREKERAIAQTIARSFEEQLKPR